MVSRFLSSYSLLLLLLLCTTHWHLSSALEAKVQNVTTTTATSITTSKSSTSTVATTTTVKNDESQSKNKTETNLLAAKVEIEEVEAETEKSTEEPVDAEAETTTTGTISMEIEESSKDNKIDNEDKTKPSANETVATAASRRFKRAGEGSATLGAGFARNLPSGDAAGGNGGSVGAAQFFDRRRRRSASPGLNLDLSKYISIGWGPPRRVKLPPPRPPRVVVKHVPVPEVQEVHHIHYVEAPAAPVQSPPIRETPITTQTERRFSFINNDYSASLRFLQSPAVQSSSELARSIVVKASGVTCNDVCTNGNIYGIIGICTIDYCICEAGPNFEHEFKQCPGNRIFDPTRLACTDPKKSILCSDDTNNPHNPHGNPHNNQNQNQEYGVPNSQYGVATGQPISSYQIPNSQYGVPAQNPNAQYGVPAQSQNSYSSPAPAPAQVSVPSSGYADTFLFANNPTVSQPLAVLQPSNSYSLTGVNQPQAQAQGQSWNSYAPNYVATIPASSSAGGSGAGSSGVDEVLSSGGFYDPNQFTNTNTYGQSSPTFSYASSGSSSSASSNQHLSSPSNLNSYVSFVQK